VLDRAGTRKQVWPRALINSVRQLTAMVSKETLAVISGIVPAEEADASLKKKKATNFKSTVRGPNLNFLNRDPGPKVPSRP